MVKVFKEAVQAAVQFKKEGGDFMADVLDLLGESSTLLLQSSRVRGSWTDDWLRFRVIDQWIWRNLAPI